MISLESAAVFVVCAAILGWIFGRSRPAPQQQQALNRGDFSNHYLQGLNYLLNEQPDKAIEIFIKMLEVDSETVETHLALGSLFRRRGETDRAIRIHQNLIARPTLELRQRSEALFELGLDYMRAGILSRAENVFRELLGDKHLNVRAMEALVDIYQQERDWEKAIEIQKQYQSVTGHSQLPLIAHYYCELADVALLKGALDKAGRYIKQALATNRNCVRASILEGQLEQKLNHDKEAIRAFQKVAQQDALYLAEVVPMMLQSYRRQGKLEEAINYVKGLINRYHDNSLALPLVDVLAETQGDQTAIKFMMEQMKQQVSVGGLSKLIDLNMGSAQGPEKENLLILKTLSEKLMQNKAGYRCDQCGFEGKVLHWQCPTCKKWSSVRPIREFAN